MASLYNKAGVVRIYQGHRRTGLVYAIAWSPDGTAIASTSANSGHMPGPIRPSSFRISPIESVRPSPRIREKWERIDDRVHVWNPLTGKGIATYSRHVNAVMSIDFSPSGRQIATACYDGTVHVWSLTTAASTQLTYRGHLEAPTVTEFQLRAGHVHVLSARWSPDGQRIASVGGDDVRVWNPNTRRTMMTIPWSNRFGESTVGWSSDGSYLAFREFDSVRIVDGTSGAKRTDMLGGIYTFDWSPRSLQIATAGEKVRVWDALTGQMIRQFGTDTDGFARSISWSWDGAFLAVGGPDPVVRVWEARSARQVCVYDLHHGWIQDLAWSPDGKYIASGGADREVHVWQTDLYRA